jgi:hypothetical protein
VTAGLLVLFAMLAYWWTSMVVAPVILRRAGRSRDVGPVFGRRPSLAQSHTRLAAERW